VGPSCCSVAVTRVARMRSSCLLVGLRLHLKRPHVPTAPTQAAKRARRAIVDSRVLEGSGGVTHRPLKVAQVDSDYFEELS
jgi:hypothetical protein